MQSTFTHVPIVASFLAAVGCDSSTSQPTAQRMAAPPANASSEEQPEADNHGQPGAPSLPQPGPTPTEAATDSNAPAAPAGDASSGFVVAQLQVQDTTWELMATLDGVTDDATAQAAAPRIAWRRRFC